MKNNEYHIINEVFNARLEDQINGTLMAGYIYELGMPGNILQSTGFPYEPIQLSARQLNMKSVDKNHPFRIEAVKNLVVALQNPIGVFSYGDKSKSQNVIVELQYRNKNFLVGVHFNTPNANFISVSNIRGLFPKDNHEWINWIVQGKALYINKKKIQKLIDIQGINHSEPTYLDLNLATKIVKEFKNPTKNINNYSDKNKGSGTDCFANALAPIPKPKSTAKVTKN
ncbi:MAG: hypothetical protein J5709_03235 [Bacteroidales bacterium]|nr:hypothetical protein [Bacteroidales bacterium]